MHDGAGL